MLRRALLRYTSAQWRPHSEQVKQWVAAAAFDLEHLTRARTYVCNLPLNDVIVDVDDALELLSLLPRIQYARGGQLHRVLHEHVEAAAEQLTAQTLRDVVLYYTAGCSSNSSNSNNNNSNAAIEFAVDFCVMVSTRATLLQRLAAVLDDMCTHKSNNNSNNNSNSNADEAEVGETATSSAQMTTLLLLQLVQLTWAALQHEQQQQQQQQRAQKVTTSQTVRPCVDVVARALAVHLDTLTVSSSLSSSLSAAALPATEVSVYAVLCAMADARAPLHDDSVDVLTQRVLAHTRDSLTAEQAVQLLARLLSSEQQQQQQQQHHAVTPVQWVAALHDNIASAYERSSSSDMQQHQQQQQRQKMTTTSKSRQRGQWCDVLCTTPHTWLRVLVTALTYTVALAAPMHARLLLCICDCLTQTHVHNNNDEDSNNAVTEDDGDDEAAAMLLQLCATWQRYHVAQRYAHAHNNDNEDAVVAAAEEQLGITLRCAVLRQYEQATAAVAASDDLTCLHEAMLHAHLCLLLAQPHKSECASSSSTNCDDEDEDSSSSSRRRVLQSLHTCTTALRTALVQCTNDATQERQRQHPHLTRRGSLLLCRVLSIVMLSPQRQLRAHGDEDDSDAAATITSAAIQQQEQLLLSALSLPLATHIIATATTASAVLTQEEAVYVLAVWVHAQQPCEQQQHKQMQHNKQMWLAAAPEATPACVRSVIKVAFGKALSPVRLTHRTTATMTATAATTTVLDSDVHTLLLYALLHLPRHDKGNERGSGNSDASAVLACNRAVVLQRLLQQHSRLRRHELMWLLRSALASPLYYARQDSDGIAHATGNTNNSNSSNNSSSSQASEAVTRDTMTLFLTLTRAAMRMASECDTAELLVLLRCMAAAQQRDVLTFTQLLLQLRRLSPRVDDVVDAASTALGLRLCVPLQQSGLLDDVIAAAAATPKATTTTTTTTTTSQLLTLLRVATAAQRTALLRLPGADALLHPRDLSSLRRVDLLQLLALHGSNNNKNNKNSNDNSDKDKGSSDDVLGTATKTEEEEQQQQQQQRDAAEAQRILHELSQRIAARAARIAAATRTTPARLHTNDDDDDDGDSSGSGNAHVRNSNSNSADDVLCALEAHPSVEATELILRAASRALHGANEEQVMRLYKHIAALPLCSALVYQHVGGVLLRAAPTMTVLHVMQWLTLYVERNVRDDSAGRALLRRLTSFIGLMQESEVRRARTLAAFFAQTLPKSRARSRRRTVAQEVMHKSHEQTML